MKKLTKIIAMTLAVLMLAAMTAVTCGAASTSTGTVTVNQAVVGENLKFWSARKGLDPRYDYAENTTVTVYSPVRTISGGFQLTF